MTSKIQNKKCKKCAHDDAYPIHTENNQYMHLCRDCIAEKNIKIIEKKIKGKKVIYYTPLKKSDKD